MGQWLDAVSRGATVNFYCCEACGYLWTVPKPQENPHARPSGVTIRAQNPSSQT